MSKKKYAVLGENLLVRASKESSKSASGFNVVKGDKEITEHGVVLGVGAGVEADIKVGDKLVFKTYSLVKLNEEALEDLGIKQQEDTQVGIVSLDEALISY